MSPPQPSLRPAQSPNFLQQQHRNTSSSLYFNERSAHKRYIRKDLVYKREKSHQEDSWLKGSGKVLDEECSLNNLERGGSEPKLKGWTNQKPTCLKENPEKDLVPMRCRAYPGLPAKSCLQQTKSFCSRKNWTQFYHFNDFTLKKDWIHKNLLLRKVLARTICELKEKHLP